tara:strand:- start:800 stop:940 length:141 start_codon:yes stop_codon:yes gene_type:complete
MPVYEYKCLKGHRFTVTRREMLKAGAKCPVCRERAELVPYVEKGDR